MSDGKQAPQNIQDAFLNTVRREKTTVVVYLLNGAKLTGRIRSFDKFSVLLESGSQEQLIFKHAISTISQTRRATGELHPHPVRGAGADPEALVSGDGLHGHGVARGPLRPKSLADTVADRFGAEMQALSPACAIAPAPGSR